MNGFASFRRLLWIYYLWFEISRCLRWRYLHTLQQHIDGSRSFRGLLWILSWWCRISEALLWSHLRTLNKKIVMVLEASGGCCESIIDGLESPKSCCEAICTLLQRTSNGFESFRGLLRIHYWWFKISKKLLWSHLRIFTNKY